MRRMYEVGGGRELFVAGNRDGTAAIEPASANRSHICKRIAHWRSDQARAVTETAHFKRCDKSLESGHASLGMSEPLR